ncbi:MAG: prepilin-type N-terminal cleavage/methylation domain-containing protein [Isosphaeraceae bacterium]
MQTARVPPNDRGDRARRGYSLLEVQVAFAILGIGLAGLCPLVVMQLRQVRQLELRLQGHVVNTRYGQTMLSGQTYYIVPWQNPWTQKLAGSGQILTSSTSACDPGPLAVPTSPPTSYPVTVITLDAAPGSQNVSAYVNVSAP